MLEANLFDDNLPSTAPLHFATLSVEPDIDLDVPNVEENADPTPSPELDVPAPRDSLPLPTSVSKRFSRIHNLSLFCQSSTTSSDSK